MITEAMRAEATRLEAQRHAEIWSRLESGQWIPLEDAVDITGFYVDRCLYRLARFIGHGQRGSPVADYGAIPDDSWQHLRWTMRNAAMVAETDHGEIVYGIQVRRRDEVTGGNCGAPELDPMRSAELPAKIVVDVRDISAVFDEIIAAQRVAGGPFSLTSVSTILSKHGVRMGDKGGLSGVRVINGGRMEFVKGKSNGVHLAKALLMSTCRLEQDRFRGRSGTYIAAELSAAIGERYPDLPANPYAHRLSERRLKNLSGDVRKFFGLLLEDRL